MENTFNVFRIIACNSFSEGAYIGFRFTYNLNQSLSLQIYMYSYAPIIFFMKFFLSKFEDSFLVKNQCLFFTSV